MAFFTWSSDYSVGVKSLDSQHTNLFGIINELHHAMKNGKGQLVLVPLLRRLIEYTESHFAAEEKLMKSSGYANFDQHRAQHVALTRKVGEFMDRLDKDGCAINVDLLFFLCDWLKTHIQQEDKAYAPWLAAHGAQ